MSSATKEKEVMANIIELYKEMPYLWNKSDKNYSNKNIRYEGFNVLLSIYKDFDENATIKTLKKKIDNLKTNYQKEYKKVKASKHTGAGNEDVYVPTIWYYDSFSFLASTTESCRSVTQTEEDEDLSLSCIEDTQNTETEMTTPTISVVSSNKNLLKKKKKETPLKRQQDILEKAAGLIDTKEEDWEILGRSIGMELRNLNDRQHAIARKLISDVIFYGTLNKLSEESFVGVSISTGYNCQVTPFPHQIQSPSPRPSPSTIYHSQSSNSPVHTLPSPLQIQSPSPRPSPSTVYHSQSSNSPVHTLPSPLQIQSPSPRPSPSTVYHSQSSNSPVHSLPSPLQIQSPSPRPSPSTVYLSQSSKSPVHTLPSLHEIQSFDYSTSVQNPNQSSYSVIHTSPSQQDLQINTIQLHIPSPPAQEIEETITFEGSGDVMKDFLIFKKK